MHVKNIRLESDTLKLRCLDEIEEYERKHASLQAETSPTVERGDDDIPPVSPTPPVKKKKNLSISSITGARTYTLSSEEDIDKFLEEMKKKLISELNEDTIITLS